MPPPKKTGAASTLIAFKVDPKLAQLLESLPNKSEFIRAAVEAQLGHVCPLCKGTGRAPPEASQDLEKLVRAHPSVRCARCARLDPRPCHPADEAAHARTCSDDRLHHLESTGEYLCATCFDAARHCSRCHSPLPQGSRKKRCDACSAGASH